MKNNEVRKNCIGEQEVVKYYEKNGYNIYKFTISDIRKGKIAMAGFPDFLVIKRKEKFYVEEKTDNCGLSMYQEEKIDELIHNGEKVVLARYNSRDKTLTFHELKERKFLNKINIKEKQK